MDKIILLKDFTRIYITFFILFLCVFILRIDCIIDVYMILGVSFICTVLQMVYNKLCK